MKFSNLVLSGFHAILDWFNQHKRTLPWRNIHDPYLVWISEIMLQQTRVDVVIPYFLKWKNRFPTIQSLALADEDEVLQLFAGLGYYSRAKNLLKGAKKCLECHDGKIPNTKDQLLKIPGIGSYTAGAILSFGFKQKAAAVDGNVLRVLSRLLGSIEPIDLVKTKNMMEDLLEEVLPASEPYQMMEGLIEFGALVCKKKPDCALCPVKDHCCAYKTNKVQLIPIKTRKEKRKKISLFVLIYKYNQRFFIEKTKTTSWNSGLYEFPSVEIMPEINSRFFRNLPTIKSRITHHEITLNPVLIQLESYGDLNEQSFRTIEDIETLALSSGHKKIYLQLKEEESNII